MDCNRLVVTGDRRVGIVRMVGTVDELGGDWGMNSDIVWEEELGGGVRGEDVNKSGLWRYVGCRGMLFIHGRRLGGAIGEYLTLGRSRVSSIVGEKPVETRFLEGSHFVKGRFGEFGT